MRELWSLLALLPMCTAQLSFDFRVSNGRRTSLTERDIRMPQHVFASPQFQRPTRVGDVPALSRVEQDEPMLSPPRPPPLYADAPASRRLQQRAVRFYDRLPLIRSSRRDIVVQRRRRDFFPLDEPFWRPSFYDNLFWPSSNFDRAESQQPRRRITFDRGTWRRPYSQRRFGVQERPLVAGNLPFAVQQPNDVPMSSSAIDEATETTTLLNTSSFSPKEDQQPLDMTVPLDVRPPSGIVDARTSMRPRFSPRFYFRLRRILGDRRPTFNTTDLSKGVVEATTSAENLSTDTVNETVVQQEKGEEKDNVVLVEPSAVDNNVVLVEPAAVEQLLAPAGVETAEARSRYEDLLERLRIHSMNAQNQQQIVVMERPEDIDGLIGAILV